MSLTKDNFFTAPKAPLREVTVPALGGSVFVRTMTAGERDRFDAEHSKAPGANFRARLVAACTVDAAGSPIFGEGDVARLSAVDHTLLDPITDAILDQSRLAKGDVEAAAKN